MSYQSLYRRYRSQTFSEIKGQSNVTGALRSAVAEGRCSHAYLFSGPRGTGKTSTARVLAKALNCEAVSEGEPCNACTSCASIKEGKSFDLHELDAASNNKVDDIRDLIAKVHLGSPGRTKVYILDEVHMLSTGAENALLKTLEEPPDHVVFVLATTEPHKVVSTIRSRTQHFTFNLLAAAELDAHVRWVAEDAGLKVSDEIVSYVISKGGGSARDTLSALDLVIAAGGLPEGFDAGIEIVKAVGESDPKAVILAVQNGVTHGHEPRIIGEDTLEVLRNSFLAAMGAPLGHLSEAAEVSCQEFAKELGPRTLTKALESLGSALVEMRQASDPRVPLEVALLNLCRKPSASSDADLSERIELLEEKITRLQSDVAQFSSSSTAKSNQDQMPAVASEENLVSVTKVEERSISKKPVVEKGGPAAAAREKLAASQDAPPSPRVKKSSSPASPQNNAPRKDVRDKGVPGKSAVEVSAPISLVQEEPSTAETNSEVPNVSSPVPFSEIEKVVSECLDSLRQKVRVRFKGGSLISLEGAILLFAFPNAVHQERCIEVKTELEEALSQKLGRTIEIVVEVRSSGSGKKRSNDIASKASVNEYEEEIASIDDLADASAESSNTLDRITNVFPGAKVVDG